LLAELLLAEPSLALPVVVFTWWLGLQLPHITPPLTSPVATWLMA